MISVDTLRRCSWLDSLTLERLIKQNHPKYSVLNSEFVGISNSGQFVYNIVYPEENELKRTKIFVWLDTNGELQADY